MAHWEENSSRRQGRIVSGAGSAVDNLWDLEHVSTSCLKMWVLSVGLLQNVHLAQRFGDSVTASLVPAMDSSFTFLILPPSVFSVAATETVLWRTNDTAKRSGYSKLKWILTTLHVPIHCFPRTSPQACHQCPPPGSCENSEVYLQLSDVFRAEEGRPMSLLPRCSHELTFTRPVSS